MFSSLQATHEGHFIEVMDIFQPSNALNTGSILTLDI